MVLTMNQLLQLFFGRHCPSHDQFFRSDCCPRCVRERFVRQQTHDERKEWIKSEGSWPISAEPSDWTAHRNPVLLSAKTTECVAEGAAEAGPMGDLI